MAKQPPSRDPNFIYAGFVGDWPASRIPPGTEERAQAASATVQVREVKPTTEQPTLFALLSK